MIFYENQKFKEVIMPRGGKRPGAGRPRKLIRPAEPGRFDLTDRINCMPGGSTGRRARFIMAMSAYGASEGEIAAALDVPTSELTESDRYEMQTGLYVAQANIIGQVWKKARAGNVTAVLWLHRRMQLAEKARRAARMFTCGGSRWTADKRR